MLVEERDAVVVVAPGQVGHPCPVAVRLVLENVWVLYVHAYTRQKAWQKFHLVDICPERAGPTHVERAAGVRRVGAPESAVSKLRMYVDRERYSCLII